MYLGTLHHALLATTAIAGLAAFAGAAHAQTNTQINTAAANSVIHGGGSSLAYPSYILLFADYSTTDPTTGWDWTSKGSGNSQCAFIVNYETAFNPASASSAVDLAASDGFLSAAQIDIYNVGYNGTDPAQAGVGPTCVTTNEGITSSITLTYPTTAPASISGPIIQLPTFGTPVTLAYNVDGVGSKKVAQLDDDQLCGIFSGAISTFGDPRLVGSNLQTATNSATVIHPTYRVDGSGTSFLFTNHLKSVCTASNTTTAFAANLAAKGPTTTFATLFTNGGGTVPAAFVGASGSGGVVTALGYPSSGTGAVTPGTNGIAYLSPDFTAIATKNSGSVRPPVASVRNAATGAFVSPTVSNTALALSNAAAPTTEAQLKNPASYAPSVPTPATGYPIVGYTTFDLAQCYADANLALGLASFLNSLYSTYTSTLSQNGFSQLTGNFATAIGNNILANGNGYNIDIENNAVCNPSINLGLAGFTPGTGTLPGR